MGRAGLCVAISVALMAPLACALHARGGPAPSEVASVAGRFVQPENCRPEPTERAAFLASVLLLPALIFALTATLNRAAWPDRREDLAARAVTGAALLAGFACLRAEGFYSLRINEFFRHPTPSIALIAASAALVMWGRREAWLVRASTHAAAWTCLLLMASLRLFNEHSPYAWRRSPFGWGDHFSAVYHPVVQATLGKTVLVDLASQYGLYPHFLAPIFAAVGPTVPHFAGVMAVLVGVTLALIWGFLVRATANRMVALVGFLAMIGNGSFVLIEMRDVYFQYLPIRMLFPAASLWLGGRFLRSPSRRNYWSVMAVLALGTLWNLDAGVPAMAAWLAVLCHREAGLRGIARHLGAGLGAIAASVAAYSAFALIRTGRWPDFAAFFAYQKMFYVAGFYMLPMPPVGGWCVVASVYLAGLAYAARARIAKAVTPRASAILHLSVLGVGLLAYYQGRSHRGVLTLAWWPCGLVLTLFLDEIIATPRQVPGRLARVAWIAALGWTLAGSAWSLASFPRFLEGWHAEHLAAPRSPRSRSLDEDVARLKAALQAGDRLLLVSRDEAILNARLGVASRWRSSLAEAILVDDYRDMARRIEQGQFDRVYVDRSVLHDHFSTRPGFAEIAGVLDRCPRVASTSRGILIDARPGRHAPSPLAAGPDP